MTMREKIARAICKDTFITDDLWEMYLSAADAVLDAMRDPTKEMVEAGGVELENAIDTSTWSDCDGNRYSETTIISGYQTNIWQAMIDAAKRD